MRADLHTHSTASDGTLAPADLVRQASERGLRVLALTDHDTTLGIAEALKAGSRLGVRVVPGVELSTDVPDGEVHILGYGVQPGDPVLEPELERLRTARLRRLDAMLDRLRALGYPLEREAVLAFVDGGSVGRPHVARAMVQAGYVATVAEAFERFIGQGRPAYVASERLEPADAIALLRSAGALPVLAHPFSMHGFPDGLDELIAAGLAGIEAWYGEFSPEQRAELAALAARYGLLATGGSDYHGPGFRAGRELGMVELPDEAVERFLATLDGR